MSDKPVDLDKIAAIARDTDGMNGEYVFVRRSWVGAVERELREGRAAIAMLGASRGIGGVVDQIGTGA